MTPRQRVKVRRRLMEQLRHERARQGLTRDVLMRRGGPSVACQRGMERKDRAFGPTLLTTIAYAEALGWGVCFTRKAP